MSSVFTKYWCQIIVIDSYFKTGAKPHKYVHKAYENCRQLTLYLLDRKNKCSFQHFRAKFAVLFLLDKF